MDVNISEVSSKKDLRKFVRFPHAIYADNLYWVPGLLLDDEALFDPKKNPAYETCRAKLWLAYKGDQVVGRVAGIINDTYISKWGNRYARFGWLDFVDDEYVARALMQQVETWAIENNMTAVHGPMGFTDFDSEGLLIDGFEYPGTMSTIYNFPYYATYLERAGYQKDVDWIEYEIKIPGRTPDRIRQFSDLAAQRYGLRVLQVKNARQLRPYSKSVFGLINASYANLYGVVPLSEKQIETYTAQYFQFIRHDFVSFILQGETLVAFAIGMPSLSNALRKARGRLLPFGIFHLYKALKKNDIADLFLIAVRPDMQNKAVTSMLLHDMCEKMIRNKITKAITHPMLEENGNVLNIWKNFEKKVVRKRRCYIRPVGK
jgi:hypothetical protein